MRPLILPPLSEIRRVLKKVTRFVPALGIIDTRSGQVYLSAGIDIDGANHATLVNTVFRVYDIDKALHLRGFVVGIDNGRWRIGNSSGLNPLDNKMEAALFDELESKLTRLLGPCPKE